VEVLVSGEPELFLKYYHRPALEWQRDREEAFYQALVGLAHFPQFVRSDHEGLWITHCGSPLLDVVGGVEWPDVEEQMDDVLDSLESVGIRHRDITTGNLCWKDGTLYLIDFGWSIWDDEEDTPVPVPHVMRPWMVDKTDREQAAETMLVLEKECQE
jgi:tRNA A-37 threonylcarbamoyl transferase component Bud32